MIKGIDRILILKWGAYGDIIASTPAIKSVIDSYPNASIDMISDERFRELFPEKETFYKNFYNIRSNKYELIRKIRKEKYDIVINLKWTSEGAAIISFLSGAKYRVGSGPLKYRFAYNIKTEYHKSKYHEIYRNLDIVKDICICNDKIKFLTYIDNDSKIFADNFINSKMQNKKFLLGIHPGASKYSKRWELSRFKDVIISILSKVDIDIILFYGKNEKNEIESLYYELNVPNVFLSPETKSIRELAALIQKCNLFLCNNSGPMNLAVSLEVPTIAILGSSRIEDWGPFGERNISIKSPLFLSSFTENDEIIAMKAIRKERVIDILIKKIQDLL